jgi:hypothetical protein
MKMSFEQLLAGMNSHRGQNHDVLVAAAVHHAGEEIVEAIDRQTAAQAKGFSDVVQALAALNQLPVPGLAGRVKTQKVVFSHPR